uniref:Uncharacterized protein n=1 Tax=Anguilla anguilla TaxID=7936 RepID=A0A0E9SHT6_ANGAN
MLPDNCRTKMHDLCLCRDMLVLTACLINWSTSQPTRVSVSTSSALVKRVLASRPDGHLFNTNFE